jgi:hypothetical protein
MVRVVDNRVEEAKVSGGNNVKFRWSYTYSIFLQSRLLCKVIIFVAPVSLG